MSTPSAVTIAGIFAGRLSQGPVALTFRTERVEAMLNANVSGIRAAIADVILERDQETGVPRFRLRNIRLHDTSGNLIAMAPRAAVDVSGRALLTGQVQPIEFELIGAQIVVRRQRDGSFQLGFGEEGESAPSQVRSGFQGKQNRADAGVAADAPAKLAAGTGAIGPRVIELPKMITSIAPSDAPAETPRVNGVASGLRSIA